jgi:hypothetical protein
VLIEDNSFSSQLIEMRRHNPLVPVGSDFCQRATLQNENDGIHEGFRASGLWQLRRGQDTFALFATIEQTA